MSQQPSSLDESSVGDDVVLEIQNASVSFGMSRGESKVLNDVSLDIQREEILGVVGESGSGKSMFASALLDAVVDPGRTTGDITYHPEDGEPVDILSLSDKELKGYRWETISMVFQGAMSFFNPTMKIRDHFVETLEAHDYDVEEGLAHAYELFSDLHLDPERVLSSYPHELSGGMQQRALIALSLVLEPEVLVMDEPTAALDLLMQRSILSLLDDLQEKYDLTVVFITHDLPLVVDICDRLAVMYAFEFAEILPTDELTDAAHPYTRALLNSVPTLSTPLDDLHSIEGSSPDPVGVPEGCSYHPRCPIAQQRCQQEDPELLDAGENHGAACFYQENAVREIPLVLEEEFEQVIESSGTVTGAGPDSGEPVVELDDLEVHFTEDTGLFDFFSEPDTVYAVDGVDLELYENDVVAIVGESGCGKTTLGKSAVGLQRPTGGSVDYRGRDVYVDGRQEPPEDIRRALQIIHQDPGSSLNPNRKIQSILEVPMKRWDTDLDKEDRQARVLAMLEAAGMSPPEDYANRYPHQLSGGEKQRVALIRALLMNPDVILADEAVSALDVSLRVEMMDQMLQLQDLFDTSYLFISHDLTNARYLAEKADGRIGVMYLGELVEIGPAEEVVNDPKHPYTQALRWSTADLESNTQGELPLRKIDVPDQTDPPEGCRYHTRCPEAREACKRQSPTVDQDDISEHSAACFRDYPEDHPYWDSEPITDDE